MDDDGEHSIELLWEDFAKYAAKGAEQLDFEISNMTIINVEPGGRSHNEHPWDGEAVESALGREGWTWNRETYHWDK